MENWKKVCCTWLIFTLSLAFCLGGCAQPSKILIGVTENDYIQIIGWMVRELATRQGIECQIREVSPGILNIQPALESNSLQVGVEFSQNAWKSVLHHQKAYQASDLATLQQEYKNRNLYWYSLPMVSDHYSLAILKSLALSQDLTTVSDLAKLSDTLTLGASTAYFEEEDGFPLMSGFYEMHFKKTINLPSSQLVNALLEKKVDVIPAHSLDGEIQRGSFVLLEDDQMAHDDLIAGLVITKEAILKYPVLSTIAKDLARVLKSSDLKVYAKNVALGNGTPQEMALQILKAKDLIYEKPKS